MVKAIEKDESTWLNRIPWKKSIAFFFLGLVILLFYLALSDFNQVVQLLSMADPVLLGIAILVIVVGTLFYTFAWQKLLKFTELPTAFHRVFYYFYIGQFFNLIVPIAGSAGIVVRSYLLREERKNHNEPNIWGRVLTSQTAMRICITIWCVVTGVLSLVYLLWQFPLTRYTTLAVVFFLIVTIFAIILLLLLSVHPSGPIRLANSILNTVERIFPFARPRVETFRPHAIENAKSFNKSMRFVAKQKQILLFTLLFTLLYYLSFISAAWLSFRALGLRQPILVICAIATVALIIELLGVGLPGGLGIKEIVTAELFTVVFSQSVMALDGFTPKAAATAASIMINVLMFWVPLALSSIFALRAIPLLRKTMQTMNDMADPLSSTSSFEDSR